MEVVAQDKMNKIILTAARNFPPITYVNKKVDA